MKQQPVAIGLLLCEQVIIEEATRNVTPVNCFTRRVIERFPGVLPPFVVLAFLTDGLGEVPLGVRISRLDTLDEIYRGSTSYRFTSPLQEVRCVVRIRGCSFPVPGQYEVMLFADNDMLAHRRIRVGHKEN